MDKHKVVFDRYMELQNKERKSNITGYEKFIAPAKLIAVKVSFENGDCLIVYCNKRDEIERLLK